MSREHQLRNVGGGGKLKSLSRELLRDQKLVFGDMLGTPPIQLSHLATPLQGESLLCSSSSPPQVDAHGFVAWAVCSSFSFVHCSLLCSSSPQSTPPPPRPKSTLAVSWLVQSATPAPALPLFPTRATAALLATLPLRLYTPLLWYRLPHLHHAALLGCSSALPLNH
ncbi:hypothetical protein CDL15_Pgr006129 [Punica granatum]|uniref:Uncharacterized protein n=1 Tax=Punica granatum TaxID=22663 RepID=A0A218VTI6_PUNGR|nr:hypothetical protein CDL15_Pgr006129 [Punica granatum]PKI68022.1 hypothetical protein CRG98_011618 [Punica granatum]